MTGFDPNRFKAANLKTEVELDVPYTIEDVTEFENNYGIKLPESFRDYILNVSREIISYYSARKIDLSPCWNKMQYMDCPYNVEEEDEESSDPNWIPKKDCICGYIYGIDLASGGCAFTYILILKTINDTDGCKYGDVCLYNPDDLY